MQLVLHRYQEWPLNHYAQFHGTSYETLCIPEQRVWGTPEEAQLYIGLQLERLRTPEIKCPIATLA